MLLAYLPIAILLGLATLLAGVIIFLGEIFGPRHPTPTKNEPYESGMRPIGTIQRRLPVRFYLIAVLFILFDIETVFFLPWAVTYRRFIAGGLGGFALAEMLVFVAILLVGYIWVWKKGALEWS